MDARYVRNVPALSEEECALLAEKRIAIIGCGGLGGHLVELAARIGIGTIRAIDGDTFDESNLNRQLLSNLERLGMNKAQAAAEHVAHINPDIHCETVCSMLTANNAATLLADCDLALDALDSIDARHTLAAAAANTNIPVVYGAIRGWVAQAALYLPGEPFIDLLYPPTTVLNDKSVLAFTPACCAAMQMALAVKNLVGRPVESSVLYYVDLLNQEFETIPLH